MMESNRATLEEAVKDDVDIRWSYVPERALKYLRAGDGDIALSVSVRILDTSAQLVPDISCSVQLQ